MAAPARPRCATTACWAHVRRNFYDIHVAAKQSPLAHEALKRIAEFYAVEAQITGKPPDLRRCLRQANARPRLERMHAWFTASLRRVSGRSDIAGAIRFALSRWQALTRYLDDGTLAIDNNPVERAIRPLVLGRKNWLFAGSDIGGERAAAIYSLIETAKLNGLDLEAYLYAVLDRIDRAVLDHRRQCGTMFVVQTGWLSGRLAVDQPEGPMRDRGTQSRATRRTTPSTSAASVRLPPSSITASANSFELGPHPSSYGQSDAAVSRRNSAAAGSANAWPVFRLRRGIPQ
jgi:hypothetical protein